MVRECGGCPFYAHSLSEEEAYKRTLVQTALSTVPSRTALPEVSWVPAPRRTGYRNRIRLLVDSDGCIAFFNPNKDITCAALEPALQAAVSELIALGARRPAFVPFAHLEVRAPDSRGHPAVHFTRRHGHAITPDATHTLAQLSRTFVIGVEGDGDPRDTPVQRFRSLGHTYLDVPLGAFMQVNSDVNRLLVERVTRGARCRALSTFIDLYAGSGNFSLPLADAGLRGVAVEMQPAAIIALRRCALAQGLDVIGEIGDAVTWARMYRGAGKRFDLAIVDAPRAGLRSGHEAVADLARHSVVLCSCNPKTFARDATLIINRGFHLETITAFDMFPGTRHVEVVAFLARSAL